MYYSQETIEQVVAANDIVDVIGSYVQLKRAGSSYKGLCPFHSEKTPSFSVSPSRQTYHCFGCGEGGNVISFVMKYENDTFPEAMKLLADRAGIRLPEEDYSDAVREKSARRARLMAVNKETASYYYRLLRSPKGETGLRYLTGRGVSKEVMKNFGLGYADGAANDLVAHLRGKGFSDEDILTSGAAVFDEKRGLHDKFWNRVIFPIMDAGGRVIGFGGRVMGDGKPKYLNSPETPVFDKSRNLYGLNLAKRSRAGSFILCEGYMDVIAMHQAGFSQAVASLGTSFTEGQAMVLRRYGKEVLLAYDSDDAGVRAAIRNIEILDAAGLTGRVVNLEPYKDPDEFIRGLGAEEFQKRLNEAENSFFYRIRQLSKNYSMNDPAQRTEFYHEIAKRLCAFEDEIERDSYIRAMSSAYYIDEGMLRREVEMYAKVYGGGGQGSAARSGERPDRSRAGSRASSSPAGSGAALRFAGAEGRPGARDAGSRLPVQGSGDSKAQGTGGGESRAAVRNGSSAGGAARGMSAAQRSALRNERLLLTWIADDPALWPQIRGCISAEDFSDGIPRRAARTYFAMLEEEFGDSLAAASGERSPVHASVAMVIAAFDDESEQKEVSALFETRISGIAMEDRQKALRDILCAVKRASAARLSGAMDDPETLGRLVQAKKDLQTLQTLPLLLEDNME